MSKRDFVWPTLGAAALVFAFWMGILWVVESTHNRMEAHDKLARQFLIDHRCARDYYTDRGVIVYKCDNGAWTEWDVWAETGAK
jgi:hypothetical protein